MKPFLITCVAAILPFVHAAQRADSPGYRQWTAYGGSPEQIRYSRLTQINRTTVGDLVEAWRYDPGESGGLQTQPIVVDGILFGNTPSHKAFALRADTGALLWTFDSGIKSQGANRGLMFWADGGDRRVYAAVDHFLYALDAKTGKPVDGFGETGRIDLRRDLDRDPATQSVRLTSPGVVFRDLLILGGRVGEGLPSSPGHVRAYDARSGRLRWIFRTIPHPGEAGHETWSKDSWTWNGGANNWPGMALDEARGIVYVPTGSAAADFYGGDRIGDNLYANSLIALDAATGKRIWHYQLVKHDIWDRDPPSPPSLVTIRRDGRSIDAVVQPTKQGFLFVFDRATGEPLFPIEHRPFPASDVPGEVTAATQPIPLRPEPFSRQLLTPDLLTNRMPEARRWAEEQLATFRNGGQFLPFALGQQTVIFPGFDGGAEWGGSAYDPETGIYYVNANDLPWTGGLAPAEDPASGRGLYRQHCAACHRDDLKGTPPQMPSLVGIGERLTRGEIGGVIRKGAGRMAGLPDLSQEAVNAIVGYLLTGKDAEVSPSVAPRSKYRFTGYRKFLDPDGYPAVVPPWGTLNAINLETGDYAWRIPLGEYPELAARGQRNTGTENYGGPIVTAGGLVFIGATNFDRKFRAFDKATGELLWETTLPFSGNATPATFEIGGRQFVVIAAGGGKGRPKEPSGSVYVAFALPRETQARSR
ncbi:MAG TPA: PQQ-binding-like beta-propeller repeat protein [Vicinamibacterales bacterium]|nr:PQQ-binding-like beta-propeller repeat protein [Vicinamibacterales bacterium]